MKIKTRIYDGNEGEKRPLLIGCSGGGGHIFAIEGVIKFLKKEFAEELSIPCFPPVLITDKPTKTASREQIRKGVAIMHAYGIGKPLRSILELTPYPILPSRKALQEEMQSLSKKEAERGEREYIDMLLDVCSDGYESAAIWNILQRQDQTDILKKLINLQYKSDAGNYEEVYNHFSQLLNKARKEGKPYTEIISTQALGLSALCDAIRDYNNIYFDEPPVVLHQYLTDLPTKGAIHFFNALSSLSAEQQQQMKLYGVGMNEEVIKHFFPEGHSFAGLYNVPANENPMVRPGFKDSSCDNSSKFQQETVLTLQSLGPIEIVPNEQIASIMLGSQASNDTVEYIETLIKRGMDKVFVFGGTNPNISKKIDEILVKNPEYNEKIIRLDKQEDREIASLMTRSNIVIIRGGGLSVMEQMAMPHNPEQTVLIHHANPQTESEMLSSGISWEDENVGVLIDDLEKKNVYVQKTSPNRAWKHIAEARIIATAKNASKILNQEEFIEHVQKLPESTITQCLSWIDEGDFQRFIKYFKGGFLRRKESDREENTERAKILTTIEILKAKSDDCKDYLSRIIWEEMVKIGYTVEDPEFSLDQDYIEELISDREASSTLIAATKSYKAILQLEETLSPMASGSPKSKLIQFKNVYDEPGIRKDLMAYQDSKVLLFISEITYQLAKIFHSKKIETFFSPQQRLRKTIEALIIDSSPLDEPTESIINNPVMIECH